MDAQEMLGLLVMSLIAGSMVALFVGVAEIISWFVR